MSMMKAQTAKPQANLPAKAMSKLPAKTAAKAPMKATAKAPAKAPAKIAAKATPKAAAKTVTKPAAKAKAPAKKSSLEAMLARVEAVRLSQREAGHFDCFGRAESGYCDQGGCAHHTECLSISRLIHTT